MYTGSVYLTRYPNEYLPIIDLFNMKKLYKQYIGLGDEFAFTHNDKYKLRIRRSIFSGGGLYCKRLRLNFCHQINISSHR